MTLLQAVLLYSTIAAGASALGVIPLGARPDGVPRVWLGWANALASGLMIGAAYVLTETGLGRAPLASSVGAVIGIGLLFAIHRVSGLAELRLNETTDDSPAYGYKVLLVNALHSVPEGVAIGVAMLQSRPLGVFMAVALAVHNMPEATILSVALRGWGVALPNAVGLAVTVRLPQVLFAVVTAALIADSTALLPWAAGFAFGSLIYLVIVELLPESYQEAGPPSIAVVTSVAMSMVVLLHGFVS